MKKILLTGFGPFAENDINPTESLVNDFHNKEINGYKVISSILPVEYKNSINILDELINKFDPQVIINLGLASDRTIITPELLAINYQHSNTLDNAKIKKLFSKINPNGKESFFSTLPIEKMILELEKLNIPVKLSSTAGTYVCNTVMYHCLKKVQQDKRDCISGFIHIPPNLDQQVLSRALTACINIL